MVQKFKVYIHTLTYTYTQMDKDMHTQNVRVRNMCRANTLADVHTFASKRGHIHTQAGLNPKP